MAGQWRIMLDEHLKGTAVWEYRQINQMDPTVVFLLGCCQS